MTVFISYRHTDRAQAMTINDRLIKEGISTYLDVLDIESQSTDDITSVITRRISESTHLIAVVSSQTAQSWWVPFEIGEATITNRRICSYRTTVSQLPEYLSKWPQMTKPAEIELFIRSYKNEISGKRRISLESLNRSESMRSFDKINADTFHTDLKEKFGEGTNFTQEDQGLLLLTWLSVGWLCLCGSAFHSYAGSSSKHLALNQNPILCSNKVKA